MNTNVYYLLLSDRIHLQFHYCIWDLQFVCQSKRCFVTWRTVHIYERPLCDFKSPIYVCVVECSSRIGSSVSSMIYLPSCITIVCRSTFFDNKKVWNRLAFFLFFFFSNLSKQWYRMSKNFKLCNRSVMASSQIFRLEITF